MTVTDLRGEVLAILRQLKLLSPDEQRTLPVDSMAMVLISMELERRIAPFPPELLEPRRFANLDAIVALAQELARGAG